MILNDDEIYNLIQQYYQEHEKIKKSIIQQAMWSKDHISLMELYSLPHKERKMVSEVIKEYYNELNR